MLNIHKNCITSNLEVLVDETDLSRLVPELIKRNVFNELMITRILSSSGSVKHQKTVLYTEILKRGPQAFAKLQAALAATDHSKLADILDRMNPQSSSHQLHESSSLDSLASNRNPDSSDSETPGTSAKTSTGSLSRSEEPWLNMSTANDFLPISVTQRNRVSSLPTYQRKLIEKYCQQIGKTLACINYEHERNRPVLVRQASRWKSETTGKPQQYKMDSNPRGCALLINNNKFYDDEEFPERLGSENDVRRLKKLLKQLHYSVQVFQNLTKVEMEREVENFSRKPELNDVDSSIVVIMSHGEELATESDTQIIGVDGLGLRTEKIITHFYNDTCKALIGKPKVFIFQACRGNLTDSGTRVGRFIGNYRTGTDGRKPVPSSNKLLIRTFSDVLVVFPAAPGRQANRDFVTGTWFIQALVDVFQQFAYKNHIEDLLKMVDSYLKDKINIPDPNFQAVTVETIGWNKNMYFNPGLFRDQTTKKTNRIEVPCNDSEESEGEDVVDLMGSNSLTPQDDDDDGKNTGCFNYSCRPI